MFLSVFICFYLWFQIPAHTAPQAAPAAPTLTGIDVLEAQGFAPLKGKRIGLITNQTGIDRNGRSTIDLLAHTPGVKLVALFSPEHGIRGVLDEHVPSTTDAGTGLPVFSLYGDTDRPTEAMLTGMNALVFDIQDAGVRFYTYIATMGYAMEAAAAHHMEFYVLDRPDPLGGERVEGPMLDRGLTGFTGYFPMPVRMGMTLGEMAKMFNVEKKIGCYLHVIRVENWRRSEFFDETRLPWVNPSPNLRSSGVEILYPGLEILQAGGVSVGRGTELPFGRLGAPWIRGRSFAAELNRRAILGVRFEPDRFTPNSGLYKGQLCQGARITVTDRAALQ
ncbi:MAG: exo-beta-N-acetylmuramidase NamZ family protein, partial [Candidatus Acidiferrales bacterium]